MAEYQQGTVYTRTFLMVLASDHLTGATGKTVTVTISKAGAAFAAPAGSVAEIGNGWYRIALTAADSGTVGDLAFHCTATDCDPTDFVDQVLTSGSSSASISFSRSAANICSAALILVGGQSIEDLEDDNDRARRCKFLYPLVRGFVLASHAWHPCVARVELNPDTDAPLWDWAYAYTLPGDFLRIDKLGEEGHRIRYRIEGQKILCDEATLKLRYVFNNTNETSWGSLLTWAMTQAMRQALAYPETSDKVLQNVIDAAIQPAIRVARQIDGSDQPQDTVGDYTLLGSRYGVNF